MKKFKFDIEIKNSEKICGGYLFTTEPRTLNQVARDMEKLGKELLRNNKAIDKVEYQAWEEDTEDYENCTCIFVIVMREKRGFHVTKF